MPLYIQIGKRSLEAKMFDGSDEVIDILNQGYAAQHFGEYAILTIYMYGGNYHCHVDRSFDDEALDRRKYKRPSSAIKWAYAWIKKVKYKIDQN